MKKALSCLVWLVFVTCPGVRASAEQVTCASPASAARFVDSFGVNTHFRQGYQYADFQKTVDLLHDLGIRQIRDDFTGLGGKPYEYAASKGITFVFIISGAWGEEVIPRLEEWEARYPGSIAAIEGPNEVNNWPVSHKGLTGVPAAMAFQQTLYEGVKASAVLRDIPVLSLTSWPTFYNKSDIGNIHPYSRTGDLTTPNIMEAMAGEGSSDPPKKRIWATEGGYHTLLGDSYFEGVSENVQAKLILSFYVSAFSLGIEKTFLYQLEDQYTDLKDPQAHFGIVDLNWRRKPAFLAVKNVLEIFRHGSETDQKVQLQPLSYKIDGLPSDAKQKLFQMGNGDWMLALWPEARIWDKDSDTEIASPTHEVVLTLPYRHASVSLFDPLVGVEPVLPRTEVDSLDFALGDHLILIRIGQRSLSSPAPTSCN